MAVNDTNPKRQFGDAKPGIRYIPPATILELGRVMKSGADKYGQFNWVDSPVSASTYVDAAFRHLMAWAGGENIDPESGFNHTAHVMACMSIVLDSQMAGHLIDDRKAPAMRVGEYLEGCSQQSSLTSAGSTDTMQGQ